MTNPMQPIWLFMHLMINVIIMSSKLLHERMKWGTVIAMGLAFSMITSGKELNEGISTWLNSESRVPCNENNNHSTLIVTGLCINSSNSNFNTGQKP